MISLSENKIAILRSLLFCKQPLICCSKFKAEEVEELLISSFCEVFCPNRAGITSRHIDILVVGESAQKLSMQTARSVKEFIYSYASELPARLVIVKNLETVSKDAANALLKAVEESSLLDCVICFVTAHAPSLRHNKIPEVLDTILSRCSLLYFAKKTDSVIVGEAFSAERIFNRISRERFLSNHQANPYVEMSTLLMESIKNASPVYRGSV